MSKIEEYFAEKERAYVTFEKNHHILDKELESIANAILIVAAELPALSPEEEKAVEWAQKELEWEWR